MKKSVEWAYPSSDFSKQAGYAHRGCWIVQLCDRHGTRLSSAHLQKADAIEAANELPNDWDFSFLYTNHFRPLILDERKDEMNHWRFIENLNYLYWAIKVNIQ